MKKINVYQITEEQFKNTDYRPDCETEEIETEDGWNYGDIIENAGNGCTAEMVVNCSDLMIWKITDDEENTNYIVETK